MLWPLYANSQFTGKDLDVCKAWKNRAVEDEILLPGKFHGRRSLVGCSPWGHEESDTTEKLDFHFSLSCIGKEMATHSSVLAWRIPGTGEAGGLQSMGSHRVGQDWSNFAAVAAEDEMVTKHHWLNGYESSKLWETVKDRKAWHAIICVVAKSQIWLRDWITTIQKDGAENSTKNAVPDSYRKDFQIVGCNLLLGLKPI